jgi:hypothetical protein
MLPSPDDSSAESEVSTSPTIVPLEEQEGDHVRGLKEALWQTLGGYMGTCLLYPWNKRVGNGSMNDGSLKHTPLRSGIKAGAVLAAVTLVEFGLSRADFRPTAFAPLILLSSWGSLYFGFVVSLARRSTLNTWQIVTQRVVPNIRPDGLPTITSKLNDQFNAKWRISISVAVALFAEIGFGMALVPMIDARGVFEWASVVLTMLVYVPLYFSAAEATFSARFYHCFSSLLRERSSELFADDPAASPCVLAVTQLSRCVLVFWLLVFLLVMSIGSVSVAAIYLSLPEAKELAALAYWVMLIAGFASFGFGSIVYLEAEAEIRNAVERVRLTSLAKAQWLFRELSAKEQPLNAYEQKQLETLRASSDFLSKSGSIADSWQRLQSVAIAVLPPLVAVAVALIGLISAAPKKH